MTFLKIEMSRVTFYVTGEKKNNDVKGGVLGNNNIGIKKCTTTFLWVLNLGQVGGRRKFFQNLTTGMIFSKMVSNLSVLEGIFETKFQGRFFFVPKKF